MDASAAKIIAVLALAMLAWVPAFAGGAKETAGNPDGAVYMEGFESAIGGWTALESGHLSRSTKEVRDGSYSLFVSKGNGRSNGVIRDFGKVLKPGLWYGIQAWVLYDQGPDSATVELGLEAGGAPAPGTGLASVELSKGFWSLLSAEVQIPQSGGSDKVAVYLRNAESADTAAVVDFYVDSVRITPLASAPQVAAKAPELPSLSEILKPYFAFGSEISWRELNPRDPHFPLLMRQYQVLVTGNEMKQEATEPLEGQFDFQQADDFVAFTQKYGKIARGHTLLWHQQVPAWFFQDPSDPMKPAGKDLLLSRIKTHITTLVGRYKGKINSWDVVNEVLDEDGSLRDSPYLQIVGSGEFIEKAFQWAHEADPAATLVINDYNLESNPAKREGMYKLIKALKDKGVPVNAVGLQMHINVFQPQADEIRDTIERFASLGIKVQVTEMDVSVYGSAGEKKKTLSPDLAALQAQRYARIFDVFREEGSRGNLSLVVLWGSADDNTWLDNFPVRGRTDYPLLFGKKLEPKPAFWAVAGMKDPTSPAPSGGPAPAGGAASSGGAAPSGGPAQTGN